ncbi:RNAse P Rpr2/Rpp21 subunit domain-containing protein [Toxoplasma gondii GT1]|uniref:RNAse P Rpr2/Rpp21 subunit domain-containing protein n=3 Tax=Toxoplasma gondii TaxID=5811 RepID=S7ULC1_TOXGG|nr:RNAse P Rpr2/Rpp21 subunit domain-containing protein [Toxoplasma gondii GT1]KAF4639711.1 RNAse P Rpr2/Rpp21 subunit domain-containing protein [Toxoplasma gondii]RQX67195.1 RNAse P Rpr2/Rpp21 subunit domain-containing protein [Toxoplasma gondii CAST]
MASLLQIAAALRGQDSASVSPQMSVQLNASLNLACSKPLSVLFANQGEKKQVQEVKDTRPVKGSSSSTSRCPESDRIRTHPPLASSSSGSSAFPSSPGFVTEQVRAEAPEQLFPAEVREAFAEKVESLLERRAERLESSSQTRGRERKTTDGELATATLAFLDVAAARLGAVAPALSASLTRRAFEVAAASGLEMDAKTKRDVCPFCGCMRIPLLTSSAVLSQVVGRKRQANRALRRDFLRQLAGGNVSAFPGKKGNSFSAKDLCRLAGASSDALQRGEAKGGSGCEEVHASMNAHSLAANRFLKNEMLFLCFLCGWSSPPVPGCISTVGVSREKPKFLGSAIRAQTRVPVSKLVSAADFNKRKRRRQESAARARLSSPNEHQCPPASSSSPPPAPLQAASSGHLQPLSSLNAHLPSSLSSPRSSSSPSFSPFPPFSSRCSVSSSSSSRLPPGPSSSESRHGSGPKRRKQFRTLEDAVRAAQKLTAGVCTTRQRAPAACGPAGAAPRSGEARQQAKRQNGRYFALASGVHPPAGGDAGRAQRVERDAQRDEGEASEFDMRADLEQRERTTVASFPEAREPGGAINMWARPTRETDADTERKENNGLDAGGDLQEKQSVQVPVRVDAGKTETGDSLYELLGKLNGFDTL